MAGCFTRMLSLRADFRQRTSPITVNGCAVYCAVVRRWTSAARQKYCQKGSDLTGPISADSHKRNAKVMGFPVKGQRLRRLRSMPSLPALTFVEISPSFATKPPPARLHASQSVLPFPPRLVLIPTNGMQR